VCECLDRGDNTAHVDECCYEDWLAFREGQASGVYMLEGRKAAYQRAMKVVEAAKRWDQAGATSEDEAWELREALTEFEEGEKK